MKIETEYKNVYVSNDGKRRSYIEDEITKYERNQLKKEFENRTKLANISTSTSLYLFKKGDIELFKDFHPEVNLDPILDDEVGYFVCIYDSSYDNIGDDCTLYRYEWYVGLIKEKIDNLRAIANSTADIINNRKN